MLRLTHGGEYLLRDHPLQPEARAVLTVIERWTPERLQEVAASATRDARVAPVTAPSLFETVPFVTLFAVAQSVGHGPLPSQPYQFSIFSQAGVPSPE